MFIKECKKTVLSTTFLLYIFAVFAMYFSQFAGDINEKIDPPIEGAYARLFCDYMGIVLAIMPVFCAVALTYLDRRYRMQDLVYTRKISSAKLVFTRYAALVLTMIIPAAVTVIIADFALSGYYPEYSLNLSVIPKLAAIWLIPNIMLAAAVGILITELSSPILAIFVQGTWWVTSLTGSTTLKGDISWFTLICRHNSLYDEDLFFADLNKFIFNRIFYTLFSLVLTALAALVFELKRRGIINELFSQNRQSKSAA